MHAQIDVIPNKADTCVLFVRLSGCQIDGDGVRM